MNYTYILECNDGTYYTGCGNEAFGREDELLRGYGGVLFAERQTVGARCALAFALRYRCAEPLAARESEKINL